MNKKLEKQAPAVQVRRRLPRSFKELTPSHHFNPRLFFYEMVWKALITPRSGHYRRPVFPKLSKGDIALTWIGHSSFLVQFSDLNILIDPNFANWLFLLKRLKRSGLRLRDLPPIDLVLLTHAHYDHFHRPTLRKLPTPKIGVMPWGVGDLAHNLGFTHIVELKPWECYSQKSWKVTLTPGKHWGARRLHDSHRGHGGFVFQHQGRTLYHAGDSAYCETFREIGRRFAPEIALLPIGAAYPETFRHVHMNPEDALAAFQDLRAEWLVPMHYGTFKLAFEEMDYPPMRLKELARRHKLIHHLRFLEEGVPVVFKEHKK
jgi:L-ascorbate metabolism protein UlaG (beta-lactamase superfamily)